jgi:adenosylhomocysteine nucleosidase
MGYVKAAPPSDRPVILVTGTQREAALARGAGIIAVAGGSNPARLVRDLRAVAGQAGGFISFGMAGGLAPSLGLGDIVIGNRLTGGFPAMADPRWVQALKAMMPRAHVGAVHADGHLFAGSSQKAAGARRGAALAVDMESHICAAVAAEAGLPFVVLRCISDAADADLPPAIAVAMTADGGVNYGAMIGSILKQPGQLGHLARTIRGFARAFGQFGKALRPVEGRLGFDRR